ncbi:hypothetical protein DOTSEDRAFT_31512 [Dothistroma septosporum NZE10]|uniref:Uncharacterized protein n=1 Tax=Dothistroma septosporum (strain NZE10 / CBS 128990) TaxID=675120 RepID=N1PXP5_DOTSN|nr:hypothetical protein DOTSEDRAFT_31512 [Dothistroma septosporum NZE10]
MAKSPLPGCRDPVLVTTRPPFSQTKSFPLLINEHNILRVVKRDSPALASAHSYQHGSRRTKLLVKVQKDITTSQTEGQIAEEDRLEPVPDIDYAFKGALSDYCRKFNMYAEILGTKARSHQPWDIGHRAQQTRREVEECVQALEDKVLQFAAEVDDFAIKVTTAAESKCCRDLESALHDPLAPRHILEFAPDGHIAGSSFAAPKSSSSPDSIPRARALSVEDPADFACHLRNTLPLIWRHETRPSGETVTDFKTKIDCLFDKFTEHGRWDVNVHAWAWAKYQYGHPGTGLQAISEAADWQMIQSLLHGQTCPELKYWDFATVYRYLWSDYCRCDTAAGRRARGDLLRSFYVKARAEIRSMVSLALTEATPEVPPELAERIIEWTMIAEGLPLETPDDDTIEECPHAGPPEQYMETPGRFAHLA